jgi:hypothetical protein
MGVVVCSCVREALEVSLGEQCNNYGKTVMGLHFGCWGLSYRLAYTHEPSLHTHQPSPYPFAPAQTTLPIRPTFLHHPPT